MNATLTVEIWKRPIREDNGRRKFGMSDELVTTGTAVSLGGGYILTAYHLMEVIVENRAHHYVKIFTKNKERVKKLAVSRCEKLLSKLKPDLCLLKGEFQGSVGLSLPKDLLYTPKKDEIFGLINQNHSIGKVGELLTGKFKKKVTVGQEGEQGVNSGLELYRTDIPTDVSNSGSVVFNVDTGRILGLTTNAQIVSQDMGDGTVKKWKEAEVIPSHTIRKYLNTPGWKTTPLPKHQTGY